jgi:23S rRNA (adenine2503-C2)-methyltransferase
MELMKINLKALSEKEMPEFVQNLGQSPYRAKQIINWIYKKYAASSEEMTDLPKSLREKLLKTAFISNLKLLKKEVSKDGTQKFLFELEDKETIESVLIPDKNRLTLCISSQVGCAMRCKFCMTGKIGLKRNLKAYEIVDQIISAQRMLKETKITNIVFMGMGEPLNNFTEVIEAILRIINLLGLSRRKITVSTAGIVRKIFELAGAGLQVNLAISLNATTDHVRDNIMPVNKKNPIKQLLQACREFPLALTRNAKRSRRITFEYVFLEGINDSKEDALRLVKLLKGIKSKVNLIPYNLIQESTSSASFKRFDRTEELKPLRTPSEDKILFFQKILRNAGITAMIRKSKGSDISAACGQLRASYFPKNS